MKESNTMQKILNDPNFVALKRFNNNIDELLERYPDGCPDRVIAGALLIEEEDIPALYDAVVLKLRSIMGVKI